MALNAASVTVALGLTGVNATVGGLSRVNHALGGLASKGAAGAAVLGATLLSAGAAGVAGLGILGGIVGKTGLDFLALKEQAQIAFTTMLGSGQKATAFLSQLEAFAAKTPFEFPDLVAGARRLLALGFTADQILPTLTIVGDAVAGLGGGAEQIDRVTLALGQMQTRGKVSAEEMNQLAENGIPAWKYLAAAIGVDIPKAMKMAEKGQISAATGTAAILKGMQKDFGGMMAAQATTFLGLISTVKDLGRQFAATFMLPVFNRVAKPALQWLTNWMGGPALGLAARLGGALDAGLGRAGAAFREFREVLGGGMGGGGIGSTLATNFLLIRDTVTRRVVPAVKLLWRTFAGGANGGNMLRGFVGFLSKSFERIGRIFQIGIDGIVTFRQALGGVWSQTAGGNAFTEMMGRIGLALRDIGTAFQSGGLAGGLSRLWEGYLQPALANAWTGITGWLRMLGQRFGTWVTTDAIPWLQANVPLWISALGTWFEGTALPFVTTFLARIGTAFGTWITESAIPWLQTNLPLWITALGTWFTTTALPFITTSLEALGTAMGEWITTSAVPWLEKKLPAFQTAMMNFVIGTLLPWLETNMPKVAQAIVDYVAGEKLTGLIEKNAPKLLLALGKLWLSYEQWMIGTLLPALVKTAFSIGSQVAQAFASGLWQSIPDPVKTILGSINPAFGAAIAGADKLLGPQGGTGTLTPNLAIDPRGEGLAGGTNVTLNVTVNGVTPDRIAQEIYDALDGYLGGGSAPGGLR